MEPLCGSSGIEGGFAGLAYTQQVAGDAGNRWAQHWSTGAWCPLHERAFHDELAWEPACVDNICYFVKDVVAGSMQG